MKRFKLLSLLSIILLITSCADSIYVDDCIPVTEHIYGFWGGTWHGMITIFSFFGSLFDPHISIYAVNNNGAWYDFGFVGGLSLIIRMINWILFKRD